MIIYNFVVYIWSSLLILIFVLFFYKLAKRIYYTTYGHATPVVAGCCARKTRKTFCIHRITYYLSTYLSHYLYIGYIRTRNFRFVFLSSFYMSLACFKNTTRCHFSRFNYKHNTYMFFFRESTVTVTERRRRDVVKT